MYDKNHQISWLSHFHLQHTYSVNCTHAYVSFLDSDPPTLTGLISQVSLTCAANTNPNNTALGNASVTDNLDPNPKLFYKDLQDDGCDLVRLWTARDKAGNKAMFAQVMILTELQPPTFNAPPDLTVSCTEVSGLQKRAEQQNIHVHHPCGRPVNVTYKDPVDEITQCGYSFTRQWIAMDNCGQRVTRDQTVYILPIQQPVSPKLNAEDVPLDFPLEWPPYPASNTTLVYVWRFGYPTPHVPTATTTTLVYSPLHTYPQNSQMQWKVEYISSKNTSVIASSPIWTFKTKAYPDLMVTDITLPRVVLPGKSFTLYWTVPNKGGATTDAAEWSDAVQYRTINDNSVVEAFKLVPHAYSLAPNARYVGHTDLLFMGTHTKNYEVYVKVDWLVRFNYIDNFYLTTVVKWV